ncbi:acetolactate synthase-1/2/3 large subunit [Pseudaminobacter salicylatoxidans]|uniref:Acetolactate synthase-1/2/3 large subunit n=1 Tax=Pseudaminobacter salicylatoxidans TaxID=93369 RepID=A0A316C9F9_PSESE|nr:acetolactate synthase large subunit [Pseudaminobacter salicylatoxidans]PWJ86310.1 acetolactate synthase-1/2/3 large subunit [Pseudaminobacter salicylatoxidans]
MNGADRLCDGLLANDVDVCFANPGTSEMHFVAALDRKPQMRCILGLFEGVVTGAADGYARMAGKPASTLLHLGPGLGNGIANLHNAKRARTPMINIVGNHATYHRQYNAPLNSDVETLAAPMSDWVRSTESATEIGADLNDAWIAAVGTPGVATLILPADTAWNDVPDAPVARAQRPAPRPFEAAVAAQVRQAISRGMRVALLLGAEALKGKALEIAGRIAAHSGVRLLCQTSVARAERGAGRVVVSPLPYRIEAAVKALENVDMLVLVGEDEPVAFFAYPGRPNKPARPDAAVIEYAPPGADLLEALGHLAQELGAERAQAILSRAELPEAPQDGALTGELVTQLVARMLPDQAIVVDESITAGWRFGEQARGAAQHDVLDLTGGAIGIGLPLSTGAAVACPDRKVVCLQADGSGMYTIQALWTQAREQLDVVTVVFANRTYSTLHGEMRNVGVNDFGENARRMLNLDTPALDWVALAKGHGVEAARAGTVAQFTQLLASAIGRKGPFLIEAVI